MNDRYILIGQTPVVEPDLLTWGEWFQTADRVISRTEVGASVVSTVFLGLDHSPCWLTGKGRPLLFETMVFADGSDVEDDFMRRCSTWLEAEAQHAAVVEQVRSKLHAR